MAVWSYINKVGGKLGNECYLKVEEDGRIGDAKVVTISNT